MSITDEDLQFMADGMWKDALLPDLPDFYGIDVATVGEAIDAPGDMLVDDPLVKNNGEASARKKIIPAARPAKVTKNKAKQAVGTSPMTDLYLSSPVEVRPKKGSKLIKSMKGASQNESQRGRPPGPAKPHKPNAMFPELETDDGDPYELPISPKSTHRLQTVVEFEKKTDPKITPPVAAPKSSSPLMALIPSSKKPAKKHKRVAKRSFLDRPSAPLPSDTEVTKVQMPLPELAAKEATPVAPLTKPQQLPKITKKAATAKKAVKPRETKKTVARPPPVKEENIDEAEDEYRLADEVVPAENMTKKLRPRGERAPILISSDPASSYEEEDYESDTAFAPDTSMTSITAPIGHIDAPESTTKLPSKSTVERSVATPSQQGLPIRALAASHLKQPITTNSVKVKKDIMDDSEETTVRGRQLTGSVQPFEKQHTHHKRQRSPTAAPAHRHEPKKQRPEPVRAETPVRKALHQTAVPNDPFVENMEEAEPQQTYFTTKLLQSAAPPVQPVQSAQHDILQHHTQSKPHHDQMVPRFQPRDQRDGFAHMHPHTQAKSKAADSDGIAREMMKLLTGGAANQPDQAPSARDIWLDETDPYKETGQIMGYVCKTILRFLKSKEAAIEDVAEEYQQRGGAVLARMNTLHGGERRALAESFEQSRQRSLAVFEAAQRDVRLLAARLERVNLVPVIQNVLADNAGSRLRLLQTEMA